MEHSSSHTIMSICICNKTIKKKYNMVIFFFQTIIAIRVTEG